jgi:hypothetical protein
MAKNTDARTSRARSPRRKTNLHHNTSTHSDAKICVLAMPPPPPSFRAIMSTPAALSSAPAADPARAADFRALFAQRIAILDGAMGSMIQTYKLEEADFRGTRFKPTRTT